MAWYWWVLLWGGLTLFAIGAVGLTALSLWRRLRLLTKEIGVQSRRLGAVGSELTRDAAPAEEPAIFVAATELRRRRILTDRARQRVR